MSQHYEPNIMQHYFDSDSTFYRIVKVTREAFIASRNKHNVNPPQFNDQTIKRAKEEVDTKKATIGKSTRPFAVDHSNYAFPQISDKRVVLVVEGTFYGRPKNIEGIIGIDITNNVHDLFKTPPIGGTIDDYVTRTQTEEFLRRERTRLRSMNFRSFDATSSKFFYFDERDLQDERFWIGDEINMVFLLPLITDIYRPIDGTHGYVNATSVKSPTLEKYLKFNPRFVSYRLKTSTAAKLARKLVQNKPITKMDIITDLAAHRMTVENFGQAQKVVRDFRFYQDSDEGIEKTRDDEHPLRLGNSEVRFVDIRDHYENPEGPYRGFNLVVNVKTHGLGLKQPSIREIQVVERDHYFEYEINVNDPAHHRRHARKRESSLRVNPFYTQYKETLERICGRGTMLLEI